MKKKDMERVEAIKSLKAVLKPGDTVYCIIRHVARSGMSRVIMPVVFKRGRPLFLGFNAATVLGYRYDRRNEGVIMSGCGMDMGFALVYDLGQRLWPKGFRCVGRDKCQSNDHSNGDRDYEPHHHASGGYALRKEWL